MTRSEAKQEIKFRYAEYLQPAKKSGTFICPFCNNGTGENGDGLSVHKKDTDPHLKCFKCDFYGDIFELYAQEHNCDMKEAFSGLYDYFRISIDDADTHSKPTARQKKQTNENVTPKTQAVKQAAELPTEALKDYTEYYTECKRQISDAAAVQYLSFRGISQETAAAYWLGYDKVRKRLIIPVNKNFYIARNTIEGAKPRFFNPKGAPVGFFNLKVFEREQDKSIFVVESAIDALSIIEAGGEAVALNSTSNAREFCQQLSKIKPRNTLILSLDNDEAGKKAEMALSERLRELNIAYITANVCGEYKDANEALIANKNAFTEAVQAAQRSISKPYNTADYIRKSMAAEITELKKQSGRKTGFITLDEKIGSVYSGLYVVGGISSVGKTTFIGQMADQMAERGQHVLFFSMEQSRLEMVSKSIARRTAIDNPGRMLNSLQIRTGYSNEVTESAINKYLELVGDRLSIIEGNFNCTVSFIGEYVRDYIEKNDGVKPVIIVDYLQVLRGEKDPDTGRKMTDTKQIVDYNVTQLKRLSRSLEIPVFIISSLNRNNYLMPIDFESFKESGNIEYTADVVWGLQLSAIHNKIFEEEKKATQKRETMAKAKDADPRDIELVCLKNRYGKRYSVEFTYYPQYDYYKPKNIM